MIDIDLDHARAFADEAIRQHHCGTGCCWCGSFWTNTGWGEEWHEPGCQKEEIARLRAEADGWMTKAAEAQEERDYLCAALAAEVEKVRVFREAIDHLLTEHWDRVPPHHRKELGKALSSSAPSGVEGRRDAP